MTTRQLPNLHVGLLWSFGLLSIGCFLLALRLDYPPVAAIPILIPVLWLGIAHLPFLYFTLLFFLPLSVQYNFSPSLATDLPTEPLMAGLMLATIIYLITHKGALQLKYVKHPLMLLLLLHLGWILITAVNSQNFTVSIKILIAKTWYIAVFIFLTPIIINSYERLKTAVWCIFIPLLATAGITIIRHAALDFSFEYVNRCVTPFFINHVNYALMLVAFYPFIWLAATWYPKGSWQKRLLNFSKIFFLIAIYFSYTRAAMIAALLLPPVYLMVKWRLTKPALGLLAIGFIAASAFILNDNRFLNYAPEFESTIYHDEFADHISATLEGKDVSSMERVYRWIAGGRMIADRPLMGVGPGNFHPEYKSYTVASFETWVSDNKERSTIHNYFLLLAVEQGLIGFAIFAAISFLIFIIGENLFHRMKKPYQKSAMLAVTLSMFAIYFPLLLNDMLETDKIGTLYFLNFSLLLIFATTPLLMEKDEKLPAGK